MGCSNPSSIAQIITTNKLRILNFQAIQTTTGKGTMDSSTPTQNNATRVSEHSSDRLTFINMIPPDIRVRIFEDAILDSLVNPPALLAALEGHPNPQPHAEAEEIHSGSSVPSTAPTLLPSRGSP